MIGLNKVPSKIISAMYFMYLFSLLGSMAGMEFFGWGAFAVVVMIGIYEYSHNKNNIVTIHPLTKYILILATILIASVLLSPYIMRTEKNTMHYIGRVRPVLLFIFNIIILERFISYKSAIKWMSWFLLPMVLVAAFMAVSGYDPIRGDYIFNWDWSFSKGIAGFFVQYIEFENIYELYFLILVPFVLLYTKFKTSYRVWLTISLIVTLFCLLISGTRVAFLSIPIAFIVQMLVSKNKKKYLYIGSLLLCLFASTYFISPYVRTRISFTISNLDKLGDSRRFDVWKSHLNVFSEHPVLGAGFEIAGEEGIQKTSFLKLGMRESKYKEVYKHLVKKAHNMFIYTLSAAGIFGFVAFILLLVAYTTYFWRTWKVVMHSDNDYDQVLLTGLAGASIAIFIHMLFDTNLENIRVAYNITFVVSLTAHLGLKHGIKTIFR